MNGCTKREECMSGCVARLLLAAALIGSLVAAPAAWAEPTTKSGTKKKGAPTPEEVRFKKRVFSGNEFRFAAMNNVNADCSSGPVPDVRVLAKPANVELRMEETRAVVDSTPENRR